MKTYEFDKMLWEISDAITKNLPARGEASEYLIKFLFAKEFGWTPEQVDNMAFKDVLVFKHILEIIARERELMLNRNEQKEFKFF